MKRFFDSCRRHRQNISLLVVGALSETERDQVEKHLAACANCRGYFEEVKVTTESLANWAGDVPDVQPSQFARTRWAKAVLAAGRPEPVRRSTTASAVGVWWHDVIWPRRRIWAGLAAVWVVILAGNLSLPDHGQTLAGKSSPRQMITAFKDQQKILAELLANQSMSREVKPQKLFSPRPRTEALTIFTT